VRKLTPQLQLQHTVVEVTQACHHRCLHCYNFWRNQRAPVNDPRTLTREEIRALVRKIRRDAPIRQIALSGGEPLLRPDLPEIVQDLTRDGLSVVVITNGTLLTAARLKRFPPGTVFQITLFSADAELHDRIAGRAGAFQKLIRNVLRLDRHGCRLTLTCVISRLNAHDVFRTIELGLALGAEAVLFNRINLTRQTLTKAAQLVPTRRQLAQALTAAEKAARRYGTSIAVSVPIPPCMVEPKDYPHLHFGWCPRGGASSYYTISHDGRVRPCNHSSVILGDLRTERFADIVNRESTRAFWRPVPPKCRRCRHPLRNSCRGGCLAASHECYGTGTRLDPFVTACT
jgi:radical SAM protein with 4Fe4S-binding SPASM domain